MHEYISGIIVPLRVSSFTCLPIDAATRSDRDMVNAAATVDGWSSRLDSITFSHWNWPRSLNSAPQSYFHLIFDVDQVMSSHWLLERRRSLSHLAKEGAFTAISCSSETSLLRSCKARVRASASTHWHLWRLIHPNSSDSQKHFHGILSSPRWAVVFRTLNPCYM